MFQTLKAKISIVSLVFVGIIFLYLLFTGQSGIIYISPTEVGVKVNYLTGSKTVMTSSGNHVFFPVIEQVYIIDSSPQKFVMAGDVNKDDNHVKRLTVRAKDGSNFYFDEIEMQYQIIPSKADFVIEDSGLGDAYKAKWIKPLARKVLRDEFGRYSSEEIANPTLYGSAKEKSKEELNNMLLNHGLRIIDISTPKPRFDTIYEQTIEARINADQEVEKQKAKREKLLTEKEYRIEKIKNEKQIEYQQLEGELKRQLISSEKELIKIKNDADAYKIEQIGIGESQKVQLETSAEAKKIQYQKDAQGLSEQIKAMQEQGDAIVYKILAEKYKNMVIELQPYSTDANPQKVQVEQISGQ